MTIDKNLLVKEISACETDKHGNKFWRNKEGKIHRIDGPAIEFLNGHKEWYFKGKRHRLDGPAVERADGCKEWWIKGNLHRLDGPAVEHSDGYKEWWIEGTKIPI